MLSTTLQTAQIMQMLQLKVEGSLKVKTDSQGLGYNNGFLCVA